MPLIATLRRLVPPKLLPLARFVYHLPAWLAPPFVTHVTRRISFARVTKPTRYEAAVLARNAKFKNMYAGRRCFVIGNGPSLNKQDLSPLANEITIVMNWFNKNPMIEKWKPTFFCMAEPRDNWDWRKLPLFLEKLDAQAYFYRIEYEEIFDEHKYEDPERVFYLKTYGGLDNWPTGRLSFDLTKCVPGCRNTGQMAIMLALHAGCSPIYLLGLDQQIGLYGRLGQAHFYPEEAAASVAPVRSQIDGLEGVLRTYRSFEALRKMAARDGRSVFNATAGGHLEIFERVNYEDIVGSEG